MFTLSNLQKPILGLAPMDGVTDAPFRKIIKKYGNPDIIFTEFTHVHGIAVAGDKLLHHFIYDEIERPVIAQIYGKEPEYFYHVAKIICALGFDGVDINMGCPAKNVATSGSGAGLIRTPELAKEIVAMTKRGVQDWLSNGELTGLESRTLREAERILELKKNELNEKYGSNLPENISEGLNNFLSNKDSNYIRKEIPVSLKTRLGYDVPITEQWIGEIAKSKPEWITIHGRTLKQMYTGKSDWNEIAKAKNVTDIPILANGDIKTSEDVKNVLEITKAEGVLIGQGTYGDAFIFERLRGKEINYDLEIMKKLMIEHTEEFIKIYPDPKGFFHMRKHFAWMVKNVPNATELRSRLVQVSSIADLRKVLSV